MQINTESLIQIIQTPNLDRFNSLSAEEIAVLTRAILKIKIEQARHLTIYLRNAFKRPAFPKDADQIRDIFLYSTDLSKLITIFLATRPTDGEFDNISHETQKSLFFKLRHYLFLDKWLPNDNGQLCIPVSVTLLQKSDLGVNGISKYFSQPNSFHTQEELSVLNKVYSPENLTHRFFLQEAHEDIRLTLYEMQSITLSIVEAYIANEYQFPATININPIATSSSHADLIIQYRNGRFFYLVETGNLAELKELIGQLDNNPSIINYHNQMSLLSYAVCTQKVEIVKYLLALGAAIDQPDIMSMTALHHAVITQNNTLTDLLLSTPCNVQAHDIYGYTPLHIAAELGYDYAAIQLLLLGANPNLQTYNHITSLHLAVSNNQVAVVDSLLKYPTINVFLKNKNGHTVHDLATYPEIQALLQPFFIQTRSTNLPTSIQPNLTLISQLKGIHPNPLFAQIGFLLLSPQEFKSELIKLQDGYKLLPNPFLGESHADSFPEGNIISSFYSLMVQQQERESSHLARFGTIVNEIRTLAASKNYESGYAYLKITTLAKQVSDEHFSLLAFAFELWRFGFLNQLINLYEKKSVMQVAIESEDATTITILLSGDPNRLQPHHYLHSKSNQPMTELEFAIQVGKPIAVEAFIAAEREVTGCQVGDIPHNAILLAEIRKENHSLAPGVQEAEDFFDVQILGASEKNWEKLLRDLQSGLPISEKEPVHGFFRQAEYDIVKVVLGKKEQQHQISHPQRLWQLLFNKLKAGKLLFQAYSALPNTEESQAEKKLIKEALERVLQEKASQKRKYQAQFHFPTNGKYVDNEFKHVTSQAGKIRESGFLVTPQHMVRNGEGRFHISTPHGTRNNNFFCVTSEAELTGFRSNDSHVVKVNITEAVRTKLIGASDVYTSPHIPAYNVARVETPIIFIGEDPRIKTIYRVFHGIRASQDPTVPMGEKCYKIHWFDYYRDDQLIGSHSYELEMRQEFFLGENSKAKAYRLIKILRDIMGPFTAGSYAHYVLNNRDNPKVIEGALAAIFNVYNVEGKVSKNIDINHPAVQIVENELAKQISMQRVGHELIRLIYQGDLATFNALTPINANFFDGELLVNEAVKYQNEAFINMLLSKGAPAYSRTDTALRIALEKLNEVYLKPKGMESQSFKTAVSICKSLLYHGSISKFDPEHVHYGASPDNCGELQSLHTWSDKSNKDLLELKNFLLSQREFSLHEMLLAGVAKQLEPLYEFTFRYALLETHRYIAKRLNKKTLDANQKMATLIKFIEQEKAFDERSLTRNELMFAFHFAISLGKLTVVQQLEAAVEQRGILHEYPADYKSKTIFSPLFSALRFNQIEIFDYLLKKLNLTTLEARAPYTMLPSYACAWNQNSIISLLIKEIFEIPTEFFQHAIAGQDVDKLKLLLPGVHINSLDSKSIILAIQQKNEEILNLLLNTYSKALGKMIRFRDILSESCWKASEQDEVHFFSILLNRFLKLSKKPNILKRLFNQLAVDASLTCLSHFFKTIHKYFPVEKDDILTLMGSRFPGSENTVTSVLLNGNLAKLKFLQANISTKPFTLATINLEGLINQELKREVLDFLLQAEVFTKEFNHTHLVILKFAVIRGRLDIVQWLFERELLQKDYHDNNKGNLLHLLATLLEHETAIIIKDAVKMEQCIDYLCLELAIDVNHRDESGNTVFLSPKSVHYNDDPTSLSSALRVFLLRIASYPATNLTLTNLGLSVLHTKLRNLNLIEKYLQQGGDINIKSHTSSQTPLESLLVAKTLRHPYAPSLVYRNFNFYADDPLITERLLELSEPPRIFLNHDGNSTVTACLTAKMDGKIYLMLVDNSPFYKLNANEIDKVETKVFKEINGKRTFNKLVHIIRNPLDDLTRLKKEYARHDDCIQTIEFIELPTLDKLEEVTTGIYKIKTKDKPCLFNKLLIDILPYLNEYKSVSLPFHMVTTEQYDQLIQSFQTAQAALSQIYQTVMLGKADALDPYTPIRTLGMPFSCYLLQESSYELYSFNSALHAAAVTSKVEIFKQLFLQATKLQLQNIISDSLIADVIRKHNIEALQLILEPAYGIKAKKIVEWSTSSSVNDLEIVQVLIEALQALNATSHMVKKINTALEKRFLYRKEDPLFVMVIATLADLEKKPPVRSRTVKQLKGDEHQEPPVQRKNKRKSAATSKGSSKKSKPETNVNDASHNGSTPLDATPAFSNLVAATNSPIFSSNKRPAEPLPQAKQIKKEPKQKKSRLN
jgi:hypothetical protein